MIYNVIFQCMYKMNNDPCQGKVLQQSCHYTAWKIYTFEVSLGYILRHYQRRHVNHPVQTLAPLLPHSIETGNSAIPVHNVEPASSVPGLRESQSPEAGLGLAQVAEHRLVGYGPGACNPTLPTVGPFSKPVTSQAEFSRLG